MVNYITITGSDLEALDNKSPVELFSRNHLNLIQKLIDDPDTKIVILEDLKPFHVFWFLYILIGNKNVEEIIFKNDIGFGTLVYLETIVEETFLCRIWAENYSDLRNPTPYKLKGVLQKHRFLKALYTPI